MDLAQHSDPHSAIGAPVGNACAAPPAGPRRDRGPRTTRSLHGASGSEYGHFLDLAGLVLRAPLRRPRLAAGVLVMGVLLTVLAVLFTPRVYVVSTRILGQRNLVMPSLGNPRRSVPRDSDAPTRAARDLILGRDNLVAIVREAELSARWDRERQPLPKLKDRVFTGVFGPLPDADRERVVLGMLEQKLSVRNTETSIEITVEWPDPQTAYEIVDLAQRSFLSQKSELEVSVIIDTIGILTVEADRQREAIHEAFSRVVQIRDKELLAEGPSAGAPSAAPQQPAARPRVAFSQPARPTELLTAQLDAKRRAIRELDEPRQRRLAELNARRARLLETFTEAHPEVIQLDAELAAQRIEPPGLAQLQREEDELLDQISMLTSSRSRPLSVRRLAGPSAAPSVADAAAAAAGERDESPELSRAKATLLMSTRRYEEVMDRIDSARIELLAAQAAFKYRYTLVEPPEVPKKAERPNTAALAAFGTLLGALLSIGSAAAMDLSGRRLVEAWQVRRKLRVPVLAEVDEP